MTLSVYVDKKASAACVLQKAVESFKLMDPEIQAVQKFHLLYLTSKVRSNSCQGHVKNLHLRDTLNCWAPTSVK